LKLKLKIEYLHLKLKLKIEYLYLKLKLKNLIVGSNCSQKVDNLFERGAASSIITHFKVDHFLDVPLLPANRIFRSSYSDESKRLFAFFAQKMNEQYGQLWNGNYGKLGISLKPQDLEIDLLGFGFEETKIIKSKFKSPELLPSSTNSSYSFIKPFQANTIIVAEVTTSIIDFDKKELIKLEQVRFFSFLFIFKFNHLSSCGILH
jgi:hypothetical protein